MRLFGWDVSAIRLPAPTVPTQQVYVDALHLLVRHYRGQPWSRREMVRRRLPDRRWRNAYALLVASGVMEGSAIPHDPTASMFLLWKYHADQMQLKTMGRYVPAKE